MMRLSPVNGPDTIRMTLLLTGIPVILSCCELLYNHTLYAPGGWLNWKSLKPCRSLYQKRPLAEKVADNLFRYPAVLFLIATRLLLAVWMIAAILDRKDPTIPVILLCCSGLLLHIRNQFSNNGSDQLMNIILLSASIALLGAGNGQVLILSIFFISCQSALSYATSGFLKLLKPDWRNGIYLAKILSTTSFGNPILKKILDAWPFGYRLLSLQLIFLEMALGVIFFFPLSVCLPLLAIGVLLHASIAFLMGFNTFFWTFVATYPCLFFICQKLHP